MKINHLIVCAAIAAAVAPGMARAGSDQAGTTPAEFLTVGSGAAIQSRGGATLGLSGDIGITPWNPGALGFLGETQLGLSHATLMDQINQEYVTAGGRFLKSPMRWSLSGLYESQGSFAGRDALNNPTGNFDLSSFAGGGHVAVPIGRMLAVGVGAKWVNETLGQNRGAGLTFDGGAQFHAGVLGIGVAAQNAFGQMRFGNSTYAFPTNYGVGAAIDDRSHGLRFAVDANFPTSYYKDVRSGVEWRWHDMFAVRAGYRAELNAPANEALSGPTFGFGVGVHGMWFDYGYIVPGNGDSQHRLGITLRPSRLMPGAMGHAEPVGVLAPQAPDGTSVASPRGHKALRVNADPGTGTESPAVPTPLTPNTNTAAVPASVSPMPAAVAPTPAAAPAAAPAMTQVVAPIAAPKPAHAQASHAKPADPASAATSQAVQQTLPPAAQVKELPPPAAPAPIVQAEPAPAASESQAAPARNSKDSAKAKAAKQKKAEAKEDKPASDDPFERAIARAKSMNAGDMNAKLK